MYMLVKTCCTVHLNSLLNIFLNNLFCPAGVRQSGRSHTAPHSDEGRSGAVS